MVKYLCNKMNRYGMLPCSIEYRKYRRPNLPESSSNSWENVGRVSCFVKPLHVKVRNIKTS